MGRTVTPQTRSAARVARKKSASVGPGVRLMGPGRYLDRWSFRDASSRFEVWRWARPEPNGGGIRARAEPPDPLGPGVDLRTGIPREQTRGMRNPTDHATAIPRRLSSR